MTGNPSSTSDAARLVTPTMLILWLVLATLPLWTLGLRILWGAFTMPEGSGMNRLLAMSALQLVAFAALFHLLAVKL